MVDDDNDGAGVAETSEAAVVLVIPSPDDELLASPAPVLDAMLELTSDVPVAAPLLVIGVDVGEVGEQE